MCVAVVAQLVTVLYALVWAVAAIGIVDTYTYPCMVDPAYRGGGENAPPPPMVPATANDLNNPYVDIKSCPLPPLLPYVLLLFFAFVWTTTAIAYVVHCTTAGVIAAWWFTPDAPKPVDAALRRACTTSLGSIAFAALIIAALETVRAIVRMFEQRARENNDGLSRAILCCLGCLIAQVEALMKYFNEYAIAHVGIYGSSFRQVSSTTPRGAPSLFLRSF
jgi:hypothetical protein